MNDDKHTVVKYIINIDVWEMWNRVYDSSGVAPCIISSITGDGHKTPKVVIYERKH